MSQHTPDHSASPTSVIEADPPQHGAARTSSVPAPVLPHAEPVMTLSGTKVETTHPAAGAAAAPPPAPPIPPAWAFRAGAGARHAAPASPPATGQGAGMPGRSLGPAGRRRSPFGVALLSVLTLGVYALVWHARVNSEMRNFDPRMHVHPGRSTLAVAVPWLLGVLLTLAAAARIIVAVANIPLPFDPQLTLVQAYVLLAALVLVPYAVLALPFAAVATVMTLERVRVVEDRVGITTDVQMRPTRVVWTLVIPVIGGLLLQGVAQRRLNRVWQTVPATSARITRL